jgi:hypothetical protein
MSVHATDLLILPVPRSVAFTGGTLTCAAPLTLAMLGPGDAITDPTVAHELDGARWVAGPARALVRFEPADGAPSDLAKWVRQPEGYCLVVDANGIRVWAATPAGRLYAAMTLRQLRRQFGSRLPCLRIGDAPTLGLRGVQLVFVQGHTAYRARYMRHVVPQLARWKINALYLYLENYFEFPSLPHLAGPGAMTADDARELDALCRAYHIKLIPMLNLLGHASETLYLQRYAHLAEHSADADPRLTPGSNFCPTAPEARRLVATMLRDAMDAFSSDLIHVGGDEVAMLGQCPRCRARRDRLDAFGLYVRHFAWLRDLAQQRGRRIGIWGDMLLHYAHNASARMRERVLAPLRAGTVIHDWHYGGGAPETLKFFTKAAFDTVASSSSNLCYMASLWPGMAVAQRQLFADAVRAGAGGGMTTAWCNFLGLHEEQFNYLFATGGTALWSGPTDDALAPDLALTRFERAYSLQRYGLRSDALTVYWHTLGDGLGPVLSPLAPFNGTSLRKCLYHTDNVLTFWVRYAQALRGNRLGQYRAGVRKARTLWEAVRAQAPAGDDPYVPLQAAPLLMHEHLLHRFDTTEAVYKLYAQAALVQFKDQRRCAKLMCAAADRLRAHLADFPPIERYLRAARRDLGLERSSLARVRATQRKIRALAAFFEHLGRSDRPLPVFLQLHDMFLQQSRIDWPGIREHDWVAAPPRFRRYTIESGPFWGDGPRTTLEPGPHVAVQRFMVSRLQPMLGTIGDVPYPRRRAGLGFKLREFPEVTCGLHHEWFPNGENGVVYLATRVHCTEPMRLELSLGYDGPIKVWVDRKPVFEDPAGTNPTYLDKARVPLAARRGTHEIMLAFASNSGRAYDFVLVLKRMDATPAGSVVLPEVAI